MSQTPSPSPRGGAAAMFFLFCIAGGAAGLGFDFALNPAHAFWIGAQPGARALLGAIVALFVIVAARFSRLLLARATQARGGRDAGDHA